ncbi:restriction endonuclease subunit S [Enterococcus avium]|uniref:restriction endonuclease subunit S n=1 Tax=Enterococcus TaxID=1350 RepID=UPI00289273F1|nr:restriction endonuclease subunit S [Enterococcus faecalis]MDT2141484.1 restriction endonuclease subunit S [Enterococcus faecalis]
MAKIDDSVKKKVPELRFKGFTDEWEERKLSDIADRFDNLRVPITASDRKPGDTPYYGANGIQDYVEGFTHNGEFILVAEDGANDLKNYPVQYVNGKVWVNNHAHVLQGKKTITDNKFLLNAIKNFNIEPFLVGGGRAKLNADVMMKLNILLPTFVEQEKIGSLFSLLDKTIALHQHKLDLLKEQKKGFLQKMFPKNGDKVPELRFAGFADDWEERKFFESIASTIDFRGRTPKKLGMDWSDSGYLALSALNVKNGYIDPLADAHYGDEKLYRKWMSGRELKKGQVLFTTEAPMGNVAQVPDDNGYILSQRTVAFETKEDMMTNDFLAVLLKSPLVFNNLSALSSGGTAKGVSQKSLKGLSITVPLDIDEQQKIGSFFKQLDETIDLHQRKLDLLKEQKKGFLQKMFV